MNRIFIFLLAAASVAQAKLPELDAIFWGQVRHQSDQSLVPLSAGNIVVVARLNGVTIAQANVAPGESQYVLKVPKDDGLNPRLPGTVRAGERVRIYVRSNALDAEEEAAESAGSGGLSISSEKGSLVQQVLSIAADFSEAPQSGLPSFLMAYSLPTDSGNSDTDGDGKNNAEEYAAGTDPTDPTENFRILEVVQFGGNNLVKFGPIRPNRVYTVWSSESLSATEWTKVGQVNPGNTGDWFLFGHPEPGSPNLFYRLEVNAP